MMPREEMSFESHFGQDTTYNFLNLIPFCIYKRCFTNWLLFKFHSNKKPLLFFFNQVIFASRKKYVATSIMAHWIRYFVWKIKSLGCKSKNHLILPISNYLQIRINSNKKRYQSSFETLSRMILRYIARYFVHRCEGIDNVSVRIRVRGQSILQS